MEASTEIFNVLWNANSSNLSVTDCIQLLLLIRSNFLTSCLLLSAFQNSPSGHVSHEWAQRHTFHELPSLVSVARREPQENEDTILPLVLVAPRIVHFDSERHRITRDYDPECRSMTHSDDLRIGGSSLLEYVTVRLGADYPWGWIVCEGQGSTILGAVRIANETTRQFVLDGPAVIHWVQDPLRSLFISVRCTTGRCRDERLSEPFVYPPHCLPCRLLEKLQ